MAGFVIPGEDLQDVGDESIKNMAMFSTQIIEAVEDDDFRIIVRLLLNKADITGRSS